MFLAPTPAPAAPILSAIPYLLFILLADCHPDLTCSPCRSLKLFAVPAAVLASLNETDEGSLRNEDAVRRAACFSANVVPSLGARASAFGSLERRANRDCSSFMGELLVGVFEMEVAGLWVRGGGAGGGRTCLPVEPPPPPIPNPGTDIPAEDKLFNAP